MRVAHRAPAFGFYVHVPFCSALCPYCDFAVVVGRRELHERYCAALIEEARVSNWGATAETMFIGGGTPTCVDAALLAHTVETLFGIFHFGSDVEISVEANPESTQDTSLRVLRSVGVNRLSIGAQSFDDSVLRALGRTHTAAEVARAVEAARAAGFANLNLDLIFGAPGETHDMWLASLRGAIALGVEHVSCYALTIEPGTAFGRAVDRGRMRAPDDDALAARYEVAADLLAAAGYEHYETSNWARPGYACRHNLLYWTQGDYLGLGVGAHSHRDGVRWWNSRSLRRYLDRPAGAREGEERLAPAARAEEWLSLRLRLTEGIDLAEASARLGRDLREAAARLAALGLARAEGSRLLLTRRGRLLENAATLALLS